MLSDGVNAVRGCGPQQRKRLRLGFLGDVAYPSVVLLDLLLVQLVTCDGALGLDSLAKEGTAQQSGNETEAKQIAFHSGIVFTTAKVIKIVRRAKFSLRFISRTWPGRR